MLLRRLSLAIVRVKVLSFALTANNSADWQLSQSALSLYSALRHVLLA